MAQPTLPDDILHVLCEELASQEQFDTLFNCACASRTLAVPALTHLYRYVAQHEGPIRNDQTYVNTHVVLTIILLYVVAEMMYLLWHQPRGN